MVHVSVAVAEVFRGEVVESTHRGSAVVVDADGRLLYRVGNPHLVTFMRSAAKPFQAIPLVESGAAKEFGLTSQELAVIAGSHSGEQIHVRTVQSILDKIGLKPEHLKCGVHIPHRYAALGQNPEPGAAFSPLEHNCSGKHAGMLALAVFKGVSVDDYLSPTHPVQRVIAETISEVCRIPEDDISVAVDGCSAPTYAMPLYNMALGYACLAAPVSVSRPRAQAIDTVRRAMREHPEMVAGAARLDTVLATSPGEPLIAKAGAEGLRCFALMGRSMGAAVKIADGASRALSPVSVEFLYKIGACRKNEKLERFRRPEIKNWKGLVVGHIEPGFDIEKMEDG